MRLMAAQAAQVSLDLGYIRWIHHVRDGMVLHRMPQPKPQRKNHYLVLLEVILRQLYLAVKDGDHMLRFQLLRSHVRSVALHTKPVPLDPQKMIVASAVRLVAGSATLHECRLVMHGFLAQIGDVAVAAHTDLHRIGLGKSGLAAGMGTMTVGAIARGSRMLHFRRLDKLGFIIVASHAQRFDIGLRQHHLAVSWLAHGKRHTACPRKADA